MLQCSKCSKIFHNYLNFFFMRTSVFFWSIWSIGAFHYHFITFPFNRKIDITIYTPLKEKCYSKNLKHPSRHRIIVYGRSQHSKCYVFFTMTQLLEYCCHSHVPPDVKDLVSKILQAISKPLTTNL